jgi:biopolymer transport protein ExbD
MPRWGRRRGSDRLDPNLTPLLDIVLQLITFFMMLIHFGTKIEGATRAVRLPTTPAALPSSELAIDRLVVAIDAAGRLLVDGGAREGEAADAWWAEQARRRRQGQEMVGGPGEELATLVVIRADKEAEYGRVRRTLERAQALGFAHFTLVVIRSEGP